MTGSRMPAEWAPHEATILTWPHRADIWRGVHAQVEQTFAKLAALISAGEWVHINVPNQEAAAHVRALVNAAGAVADRVVLHLVDSDDVWARDHGPTVVLRQGEEAQPTRVMLDWVFNAWGDKYPSQKDNAIVAQLEIRLGLPRECPGLVLEGGSIEVNGMGDLLTTESVLLNPNRNPGLSQDEIERRLCASLGVDNILWLGDGLLGDDTDGHIDDLARFVDPRTIVTVLPDDPTHPDYRALTENLARLRSFRDRAGRPFFVHTLPMPAPVSFVDEDGQPDPLPASYANFYVANAAVIVPVFDQPTDAVALQILQELIPDRPVIGLDARALVSQYGAFHCVTQQIPAKPCGETQ